MADYAIYDVTPGETAELTFTVRGLDGGETFSNATLEIRSRIGQVVVPVKTITPVETPDGLIDVVGGIPTFVFNLTTSETQALQQREPFYLYSVVGTTSLGRRQMIIPIGKLSPSHTIGAPLPLKLGSATFSIQLRDIVVAGKQ